MGQLVECEKVNKVFKNGVHATNDLSFSIERGEVFGLLGPNGAGKTTLLKQICGLFAPDSGKITVEGLNPVVNRREVLRKIGYVTQHTALYDDLNAYENMFYHANLYLDSLEGIRKKIEQMVEFMQLGSAQNRPVGTYSGGMRRRLAIGQVLLHDPKLILLDEPTLGVDVQATHNIWNRIKELAQSGKTIIVTTNNMQEADYLSDRVMIIDRGKRIALDTPQNLKDMVDMDKITVQFTDVISEGMELTDIGYPYQISNGKLVISVERGERALPQIMPALTNLGTITDIKMKKTSLDDVFLKLTGRELREV